MTRQEEIRNLMKDNIVLAVGCTEPVAVALAVAKAKELLGEEVEKVELSLSKNIIKNAMGVGIPGTGMIGLPIAVALGVVCGHSCKELQVLEDAKDNLDKAKNWLATHKIEMKNKDTDEKLYIECCCHGKTSVSKAVIAKNHTNFVLLQKDDNILPCNNGGKSCNTAKADTSRTAATLSIKEIYDYATQTELSFIEWIYDMVEVNLKISQEGLQGNYGLRIGKSLMADGDLNTRKKVIAAACSASDARMDGATLPVYSNSGSGNQGITCSVPVAKYAEALGKTKGDHQGSHPLKPCIHLHQKQNRTSFSSLRHSQCLHGSRLCFCLSQRRLAYADMLRNPKYDKHDNRHGLRWGEAELLVKDVRRTELRIRFCSVGNEQYCGQSNRRHCGTKHRPFDREPR